MTPQALQATRTPSTQSGGAPAPFPGPAQWLMLTWHTGSGGTAGGTRGSAGIRLISRVNPASVLYQVFILI